MFGDSVIYVLVEQMLNDILDYFLLQYQQQVHEAHIAIKGSNNKVRGESFLAFSSSKIS